MKGDIFCGITLKWDYRKHTVQLSTTEYVWLALERFQHILPTATTDAPHEWKEPFYGIKRQYADNPDTSPLISQEKKTYTQQVIGVFIYYKRMVDITIIKALNPIVESQAAPTENMSSHWNQWLDYLSWHTQEATEYKASDMQLWVHGDEAYLVVSKACIQIAVYLFLSETPGKPLQLKSTHDASIYVKCWIMEHIVVSAAEAECGALFHKVKLAVPIKITL